MKCHHLMVNVHSWASLEKSIAGLQDEKARGDAFEVFCAAYLKLIPEYCFKSIFSHGHLPKWIIDQLRLTGQKDQGIDLIAVTNDDKIWAIQAKFRSDRSVTVPYRELSTFLGISDRADYRLIISNTNILPPVVQRRSHFGEVLVDRLDALDADFFSRLSVYAQGQKPAPIRPFTPKDHQIRAIQAAVDHFKVEDRGQLIMACGTGKTLTSVWIAEHLKAKATLVMVPSLALMRQTVSVWAKNYKKGPFNYFCICSDDSVADDIKSDYATSNLWEMDIPVTTDPNEAGKFVKQQRNTPFIIFSTYQSSTVLSTAISKIKGFKFDLIISDEAHRTAGMAKGLFNHVLDDRHIPSRKRLFMTATPRILAKHIIKKGIEEDVDLFSMADETKYGREFYRVSFGDAIKRKLLTDYKVVIAVITNKELYQIIQKKGHVQVISKEIYAREATSLAKQVAYLKALKSYGIRHTISYHSRVSYARSFSDEKNICGIHAVSQLIKSTGKDAQELKAFHVNGTMSAGERSGILQDFAAAPFSVVSNARCLTEGVDIPSLDGVLFFDPKYRLTDIVQATGRAIRLYPGKQYGYLIVPVFIKDDEDIETALGSSDFSQVWSVIKAMQEQDERLYEVISKLRTLDGEIKGGNNQLSNIRTTIEEQLFEKIQIFNVPKKISAEKFFKAVETRLLDTLGFSWDYQYGILKEFRRKLPNRWPAALEEYPKGNNLGRWCDKQRTYYRNKQLTLERVNLLEKINFKWNILSNLWPEQYQYLVAFRRENPDRWPDRNEEYPKGNSLGAWCTTQRQEYRSKKLALERVKLLEKLNFKWDIWNDAWQEQYQHLVAFRQKNPSLWPKDQEQYPTGNNLGSWCQKQRQMYLKKQMSLGRSKLLEQLGFQWDIWNGTWQEQYQNLVAFKQKNPDRWPIRNDENPKEHSLASWCVKQRTHYHNKRLTLERINLFEQMGFPWDLINNAWQKQYQYLVTFRQKNLDRWPVQNEEYPTGNRLGNWCQKQRYNYRSKKMSLERIKLLEKLGFNWNILGDKWPEQYQHLIAFRQKNPGYWPNRSKKNTKEIKLASWCGTQRHLYHKKQLSTKRVKLLEKLGFNWNILNSMWPEQYQHLVAFRQKNPNRWPYKTEEYPKGNKLGFWCGNQRQYYSKKKLSSNRIKLLEKLGFKWNIRNDAWQDQYQHLIAFKKFNPDRWPKNQEQYPKGNNLGVWCNRQRQNYRLKQLPLEKFKLLRNLGFKWIISKV